MLLNNINETKHNSVKFTFVSPSKYTQIDET